MLHYELYLVQSRVKDDWMLQANYPIELKGLSGRSKC